jgi:hypothetical protein
MDCHLSALREGVEIEQALELFSVPVVSSCLKT